MLFNVPQYIDVEDKVAGPLTAKQLLWMIGMGAVLMVLWGMFESGTFYALAVPVVCAFVALAFYRPYNQPLIVFIGSAILFIVRPKVYVWNRPARVEPKVKEEKIEERPKTEAKNVTAEELSRLAKIVDGRK